MNKGLIWGIWLALTLGLVGFYGNEMFVAEQKPALLIGEATHGHHQIEMSCETCHTDPFGGKELVHEACLTCHQEELKTSLDAHPMKKFTNPRNADLIATLDATNCVTCHNEHKQEHTFEMGVTLPVDFCAECHSEIGEERESHKGMGFETCASAGCHNFHDNRALYEDFLVNNSEGPFVKAMARVLERTGTDAIERKPALTLAQADAPESHADIAQMWSMSGHADAGVNCTTCHEQSGVWVEQPEITACESCHTTEVETFQLGKHGMRLAVGLSKMTPAMGRLPFHEDADQSGLDCASCHDPHQPDMRMAAVEACTSCHADDHTNNYKNSTHAELWQQELAGNLPENSGVSCATCHMPREEHRKFGVTTVHVQHNQNMNLRPNEKMIRSVCMNCHSLEFSIDALADPALIKSNFSGRPTEHIKSIDMVLKRVKH
ncbi:MAG: cytochrome c3 family protein [Pontibacterium sp.]